VSPALRELVELLAEAAVDRVLAENEEGPKRANARALESSTTGESLESQQTV
jgi:hypothetical protein